MKRFCKKCKYDNIEFIDSKNINKDLVKYRRNFVANRVVYSQLILLFLTNLFTFLIILLRLTEYFIQFWYIYIFIIPVISVALGYIKRRAFYFKYHWLFTLAPLVIPWLSITIYVGVVIDYFLGFGKTIAVSLILSLFYLLGYALARILKSEKVLKLFKKESKIGQDKYKSNLFLLVLITSLIFITFTLTYGLFLLNYYLNANNIESIYAKDYGEFRNCLQCVVGAFIIISGIGIVTSMVFNYIMLSSLTNIKGYSVEKDPPNRLILAFLCITAIIMGICWIFAELLFPPIPGGGGGGGGGDGGGGGGGGNGSSKKDKSLAYKKIKGINNVHEMIEKEWEKNLL